MNRDTGGRDGNNVSNIVVPTGVKPPSPRVKMEKKQTSNVDTVSFAFFPTVSTSTAFEMANQKYVIVVS